MASRLLDRLLPFRNQRKNTGMFDNLTSYVRMVVSGTFFRMSDLRNNSDIATIKTKIDVMRALAQDSQVSTALSYYATDATQTNASGQVIWATSEVSGLATTINTLFTHWDVNTYARDHILELATYGNFYMPTTDMYKEMSRRTVQYGIALDNNTIPSLDFDIVPAYKIDPENIVHVWFEGTPFGYMVEEDDSVSTKYITYPESAVIHFSLGGLLGDYTITTRNPLDNTDVIYDIQFAQPLMDKAVQPTQTLSLLEDSTILSSLIRVVRFINVEVGGNAEPEEIRAALQEVKNAVEQQLSINTASGDVQSFVNPQSPNNLIYMPRVNGQDPVSITELNMAATTDEDSALLEYYQNKKLSVLGVPKEAMNYSSNEGLGGAGSVLAQRSAIYANGLQRIMAAYKAGWTKALNLYFTSRGLSSFVDKFELHMAPIITQQATIQFERRDAAIAQATSIVEMMRSLGIGDVSNYQEVLEEVLMEVFPKMGTDIVNWEMDPLASDAEGGEDLGF